MWEGKRMREIFRGEGERLSQHYDFRRMRIYKGRHGSETYRRRYRDAVWAL